VGFLTIDKRIFQEIDKHLKAIEEAGGDSPAAKQKLDKLLSVLPTVVGKNRGRVFAAQIEKLLAAGNPERARKLVSVAEDHMTWQPWVPKAAILLLVVGIGVLVFFLQST